MAKKYKAQLTQKEIFAIDLIKRSRKNKGISQYQLADKVNISQSLIAQIENGWKKPDEEILNKIFKVLDINLGDLSNLTEDKSLMPIIKLTEYLITDKAELSKLSNSNSLFITPKILKKIQENPDIIENIYGYIMPDNSMSPEIKKEDIIIIQYLNIDLYKTPDDGIYLDNTILAFIDNKSKEYIRKFNINVEYFFDSADGENIDTKKVYTLNPLNPKLFAYDIYNDKTYIEFERDPYTGSKINILNKKGEFKVIGKVIAAISEKFFN